jgi:hypothetical protein
LIFLRFIDCPGISCLGIGVDMKEQFESYALRIAAQIQHVSAEVDPEILQLPGGSVIATLLWLYAAGSSALRKLH